MGFFNVFPIIGTPLKKLSIGMRKGGGKTATTKLLTDYSLNYVCCKHK